MLMTMWAKAFQEGLISLRKSAASRLLAQDNTIIGNTVLYGATSGALYASGRAGERLAVRNSGAVAVVEGCGSNGCEYMTSGKVVVLGSVGNNFGAGMTGGMAFVFDEDDSFKTMMNPETLEIFRIETEYWEAELKALIEAHYLHTGSAVGGRILGDWQRCLPRFWHIVPSEVLNQLPHSVKSGKESMKTA